MIKSKRKCGLNNCENPHFAKNFCKWHQWKRTDSKKPKPISRRSKKRSKEEIQYSKENKIYLKLKENLICPVAQYFLNDTSLTPSDRTEWARHIRTNQVHHKGGRIESLLLKKEYWLAVSQKGHDYIHDNPKESYEKGWLIKSSTI